MSGENNNSTGKTLSAVGTEEKAKIQKDPSRTSNCLDLNYLEDALIEPKAPSNTS